MCSCQACCNGFPSQRLGATVQIRATCQRRKYPRGLGVLLSVRLPLPAFSSSFFRHPTYVFRRLGSCRKSSSHDLQVPYWIWTACETSPSFRSDPYSSIVLPCRARSAVGPSSLAPHWPTKDEHFTVVDQKLIDDSREIRSLEECHHVIQRSE